MTSKSERPNLLTSIFESTPSMATVLDQYYRKL